MAKTSAKTSSVVSALEYLSQPGKYAAPPVCAVYGDEAFLKSETIATLRKEVLSGEESEFSLTAFGGRETQLREVLDALSTASLFGDGKRLVIVEDADTFVSEYRDRLEDYVSRPARTSVLVLEVKTWPGNTRLAKAVASGGLSIECKTPTPLQMKKWLEQRAKADHSVRLEAGAVDALLELLPAELGLLTQEVARLALLAGERRVIDARLVQENVGGWKARATWDMVDATADGRAASALVQLARLIASGEKPHGLLPQMASSLRRFATAVELIDAASATRQKLPFRSALAQAGVFPNKLGDAERQLRQIGSVRARLLTRWLLATDLAIKGHNSSDDAARIELERLIVRLSANAKLPA